MALRVAGVSTSDAIGVTETIAIAPIDVGLAHPEKIVTVAGTAVAVCPLGAPAVTVTIELAGAVRTDTVGVAKAVIGRIRRDSLAYIVEIVAIAGTAVRVSRGGAPSITVTIGLAGVVGIVADRIAFTVDGCARRRCLADVIVVVAIAGTVGIVLHGAIPVAPPIGYTIEAIQTATEIEVRIAPIVGLAGLAVLIRQ